MIRHLIWARNAPRQEEERVTRTVDYYFSIGSPWTSLGHTRFMAMLVDRRLAR